MMPYSNEYDAIPICRTHGACVNTPNFDACVRQFCRLSHALSLLVRSYPKGVNAQGATTRVASNYPFAKLMEIAESVPTGRVRATSDNILNFYNFMRAL